MVDSFVQTPLVWTARLEPQGGVVGETLEAFHQGPLTRGENVLAVAFALGAPVGENTHYLVVDQTLISIPPAD